MKARAPGKVVLSGAYAVLEGAPAIVAAVDRFAVADAQAAANFVSDEVKVALSRGALSKAPHIDASALRAEDRKLGLGSSAAILVASLAASGAIDLSDSAQTERLFRLALGIHREAQRGGSGVDVAASTFGGTFVFRSRAEPELPEVRPIELPPKLHIEVWSSRVAASTRQFIAKVKQAEATEPTAMRAIMAKLSQAATQAVSACAQFDQEGFIGALQTQRDVLFDLGELARIPICTVSCLELDALARTMGAVVLPAGAGGGDVSLFVGKTPPSASLTEHRVRLGLDDLGVTLGAHGVRLEG